MPAAPPRPTRWLLATSLLAPALAACGDDTPPPGGEDTIADKVAETAELSQLERALDAANLTTALDDPGADLTLFAPTDEALARFAASQGATLDTILAREALADQLRYHLVDGALAAEALAPGASLTTLEGRAIELVAEPGGVLLNDDARLVATPIEASNGVIYVIDAVLARPTTTVYESAPAMPFDEYGVTDSIVTPDDGHVRALEVELDIDHDQVYELYAWLANDATGEWYTLLAGPPTYADDVKTTLSDRAPLDAHDDVAWSSEDDPAFPEPSYRPYEPLRFAYGQPAAGTWTLYVQSWSASFEDSWLNRWALRVTTTEERPDPALAIAMPRGGGGVIAHGFQETLQIRVKRVAGLTGPIEVTLDAEGVESTPATLAADVEVATIPAQAADGATAGPLELRVDATAGDARRRGAIAGGVVEPDARGVELLAHVPLSAMDTPGGNGNDIWGWTDPLTSREYALVGTSHGTAFVDVTEPTAPRYLGILPTHTDDSQWRDIKVYEDHAFVVSEATGHGLQVFDLTRLRDVTTPQTFTEDAHHAGFGQAHNVVIDEDTGFAYVVGAVEELTDPLCGGGLLIIDIREPTEPTYAGCFGGGVPAGHEPGPAFPTAKYTHDAQCVVYRGPDADHANREICVTSDGSSWGEAPNSLGIADLTAKDAPVQLARITYEGAGYTHQGWLTEDHQYFLLDDEFDEDGTIGTRTYIFDVRDLDAPTLLGTFDNPRDAIGHNLYVHDGFLFQANYTSGLRIVDLAGVATADLAEVAYFDTHPEDDADDDVAAARRRLPSRVLAHPGAGPRAQGSAYFGGAWSSYPYFASGTIVIGDMERGLVIVRRAP